MAAQNANAIAVTGGSATGLSSIQITGTTPATSTTTGALTVAGGVGIQGSLYVAGTTNLFNTLRLNNGVAFIQTAPSNISNYAVYGLASSTEPDIVLRLAFGLDSGQPFLTFGPGLSSRDVSIRRQSAKTLRISELSTGLGAATLEIIGTLITDNFRLINSSPPATQNAPGALGQFAIDSNYIYVCTATNTWKRAPISGW